MFIREYLRVFFPLVVMLAIYRAIAVPLIEPKVAAIVPLGQAVNHDPKAPWWNAYFLPGKWQLDQPKMIRTSNGTVLLFGKLEKLPNNRIKLFPLTILIPQKGETLASAHSTEPKQRALIIENPLGMEIQFRDAIDFLGGQLPPVKGGQMIGEIMIFAPPKDGSSQDGILIETSELRIDRRHIWTTRYVSMKIGQSHVQGKDLSIYLDQDLLSSKDQAPEQTESPVNGLDRLELIYVEKVHIDLPDDGLFAEKTAGRTRVQPPRPAHAAVNCEGAFEFDFHQSLATLSKNVALRHQVEGLPQDTFQCDRLTLHFRWLKTSANAVPSTSPALPNGNEWSIDRIEASGTNSLNPKDPSGWVRLEAPSMNARGQGRSLKIELDRGRILLANHLPGVVPNDSSQVYLQRDSLQVWSPEIEYESQRIVTAQSSVAPANPAENQQSFGQLWAAGPGYATVLSEDGDPWRLSWAKSLQLQPEGRSDRLTIDGSANASSERQGRFSADTVDLWLTSLNENVVAQVVSQGNGYRPASVLPERMHAAGQVRVNTSQLRLQVNDMKFWFSYPEIDAAKKQLALAASVPAPVNAPLQLAGEAKSPERKFTLQPNAPNPGTNPASSNGITEKPSTVASPLGTAFSSLASIANGATQNSGTTPNRQTTPVRGPGQLAASNVELPSLASPNSINREQPPQLPMTVTGETLVAKLSQTSQGMSIDDLAISGGLVTITRDQVSETSPWPLTITGSQVEMNSSDGGRLDATIVGTPAKFAIGSGSIESTEIRFNEHRQMVWIDQPGTFRIPPEAMQSIASKPTKTSPGVSSGSTFTAPGLIPSRSSSNPSVEWIEAPEILWQGRMVFDGRTVKMDGGVKLNGRMKTDPETIWHLQGVSKEMLVELQEPIVIGGNAQGEAKIANVRLLYNVDLKAAQTDLKGNRRSLDHLEVPELMLMVPQQQWIGTGPGSLRSRRIGNANPGSPKMNVGGISNELPSQLVRNPEAELQCLHLTFRGRMEGDMNQQLVSFHDRVEALIEPIFSWDQTPDVKLVDRLRMGQTTMECDQLSVYNTANLSYNQTHIANQQLRRDAAWEVTGAGHVRVDSVNEKGALTIIASRAQYVALHTMLRIEGDPREPAVFEETPANFPPGAAPITGRISSGAINLKTGEATGKIIDIRANLEGLNGKKQQPASGPAQAPPLNNGNNIQTPRDSYPLRRL